MRSFGRTLTIVAVLVSATTAGAQSDPAAPLYQQALARETSLRREMDAPTAKAAEAVLEKIRTLVQTYEDLWRFFPKSGVVDNALWQGAKLAADAFWEFGEAADKQRALELFGSLASQFPGSSLTKQAEPQIKRLQNAKAATASTPVTPATPRGTTPPPSATTTPPASPPASLPPASLPRAAAPRTVPPPAATPVSPRATATPPPVRAGGVVLRSIRREQLPDALRVILELDGEALFRDERIDGPPRVFLDLQNARPVDALKDSLLSFDDDVVRRIRVGRQADGRVRVAMDLQGASRYSAYALYNPFRVVIDFERVTPLSPAKAAPSPSRAAAPETPRAVAPAPPATNAGGAAPPAPPASNGTGGFSLSRQLGLGVARIVIDPGHGGRDPGAKSKGLDEAELVLDVALRLEKLLAKQAEVEVVLTRRRDEYVALEERTAIANRSSADLFLSIHANASKNPLARGIETYYLNFATNSEAEAVAARENADSSKTMSHLPDIVRAIALNNKIDESRDFATIVQRTLFDQLRKSNRNVRNLGVKQAPFMVLIGATMPSILAEISFITNGPEGTLLRTEKYRQQIAEALAAGVMQYQRALKKAPAIAAQ